MEQKSGAQISQKALIQSAVIQLVLMLVADILTLVISRDNPSTQK